MPIPTNIDELYEFLTANKTFAIPFLTQVVDLWTAGQGIAYDNPVQAMAKEIYSGLPSANQTAELVG